MKLLRERFVGQFAISVAVHSLKLWNRRATTPPRHVAGSIHATLLMCGGVLPLGARAFSELVTPVIDELHQRTPKGRRPDASELTGLVYDALDRAGVEVSITPPIGIRRREE
jgi:hypothetical protein